MVFTCLFISVFTSPFSNPLGIVPSAPNTIDMTVTFMFHSFFSSLARSRYFSIFSFTQLSSIWPIDRTLLDAATPGQSGPGSDGSKGVLHIPQNSNIIGTSPSDCLVLYPEHSYPSAGKQSVYSMVPTPRKNGIENEEIYYPPYTSKFNKSRYAKDEMICKKNIGKFTPWNFLLDVLFDYWT